MNIADFLQLLLNSEYNNDAVFSVYQAFVAEFNNEVIDENVVKQFFSGIKDDKFSEFEEKLGRCLSKCRQDLKSSSSISSAYNSKLQAVDNVISNLVSMYRDTYKQKFKKPDNVSATIAQHEDSLTEIREKIASLNTSVDNATKLIDEKSFTLLINTVAILGIFVAIAFTGFGISAIFPKIDIAVSLTSDEYFIKNIFYLLSVSLICYNLLLLLFFLIFKLSRPLFISSSKDTESNENENSREVGYVKLISFTPFFWIDGILAILTIVTFIAVVVIW